VWIRLSYKIDFFFSIDQKRYKAIDYLPKKRGAFFDKMDVHPMMSKKAPHLTLSGVGA